MKTEFRLVPLLALTLTSICATLTLGAQAGAGAKAASRRPEGPCDVYAAAGDPCVAAHSTTRALYGSYNGPLYQVLRQSDRATLDIGVVQPTGSDKGGYADSAKQDAFCANTYCWIATVYDQSGRHNDLTQPPRGGFSGPAMGGFDNLPLADMAPITIMGHKVYGVFIEPGMGLRQNDAKNTAVDDQAEGQYWVINGHHYNAGCCFDYGNAETDSRDDGNGTMETTYYGDSAGWYHGPPPGPWTMTDQENNLVGCVNPDGSKLCASLPSVNWRFVTAIAKGEPHHWTSMGGDAQQGALSVMFNGPRVNSTYDPMRKQGAILLGNGGDNSNSSQGTFYEGAITAAKTFPADATDQLVQANVVAAKYAVAPLVLTPASASALHVRSPGLQTFSPGSSQQVMVTFTNTTGTPLAGVQLAISAPKGSTVVATGFSAVSGPIAPGASVSAPFKATSGTIPFNGDLVAKASWTDPAGGGRKLATTIAEKMRNVSPIKINEFRIGTVNPVNSTNSFIEIFNAGARSVNISNWTLTEHPTQQAIFSEINVPAGTRLAAGAFYVLGLSASGLAVPARAGDATIYVRSTSGMTVGDTIGIDDGASVETRRIAGIGTPAGNNSTLWQPVPDGPVITIPAGSTNIPVTGVSGFAVGDKIAIGYGAKYPTVAGITERYEIATVTAVGKAGTQAYLGAEAPAGATNIKVTSVANISAGDKIRLDIDSVGHGIETVTVTHVGTQSSRAALGDKGTGLDLAAPLQFSHAANMPFSDRGTGISFLPATLYSHSSNEPVQPLGTGITLASPLGHDHAINAVVQDTQATTSGYQGSAPNQWFGGPALSPAAGSMVLRDAAGHVVDSLNYSLLVDPWAAEGYQETAGSGQSGCRVAAPAPGNSAGRFPDGVDTDSNCTDFMTQAAAALAAASSAGAISIKVASTNGFDPGQTIMIDTGSAQENAVIAMVGTPGATTLGTAAPAGATTLAVASSLGFRPGQTITIDSGANSETAVVAFGGRRGAPDLTVTESLKHAHGAGAQVSGTGITLTAALTHAHASGARVADNLPTPGAPNRYSRKSQ